MLTVISFISIVTLMTLIDAVPYPWQSNDVGYDESLDPIIWSRAFAKDTIRKPRYFKAFSLLRNLVGDERRDDEEELNQILTHSGNNEYYQIAPTVRVRADERNFGKRRRKLSNNWYADEIPLHSFRKYNSKKLHSKRSHKLNVRENYGLF